MPSKFECIVYPSNQERKGFGSKSIRFTPYENEDPGPGSYWDKIDIYRLGMLTDSDSKKVEGKYFISCDERFWNEELIWSTYKPGPG